MRLTSRTERERQKRKGRWQPCISLLKASFLYTCPKNIPTTEEAEMHHISSPTKSAKALLTPPYPRLSNCFLSSHGQLRCHQLWNCATQTPWNISESPNWSVTKSTLWRSSGLLNQTDTHTLILTSVRIIERPECVSLSASLNLSQKLLIKLSACYPAPFANPAVDRFEQRFACALIHKERN